MNYTNRGFAIIPLVLIIVAILAVGTVAYVAFVQTKPDTNVATTVTTNGNANTNTANASSGGNADTTTNTNATANVNDDTTTTTATSYGLWFPFSTGQTVNNPRPVIYGRVEQRNSLYLDTTFGQIDWAGRDFGGAKMLSFTSGPVSNLAVRLDGQTVSDISGFTQYPSIVCWKQNFNSDGSKTLDRNTNTYTPADTLYTTAAECQQALRDQLPPLIFVFRPDTDLTTGQHTLNVNGTAMTFIYDPSFTIAAQTVPAGNVFGGRDTCAPGYYQSTNDLPLALPTQENAKLFYGVSFPQSAAEKGSIQRRRVNLSIGGKQYPLFFPDSTTFFQGAPTTETLGDYQLFLPLPKLVYSDGKPATLWPVSAGSPSYTSSYYSELFPVDISGHEYRDQSIPWEMSTSSGCDG